MEKFCRENKLQPKAIKEVHYLCLQLQRIFFALEEIPGLEENKKFNLASDTIKMPTLEDETIL